MPSRWKVSSSRWIVKDPWIAVRADACLQEDGRSVDPYYVLEYDPWVSVLPCVTPETVLLIDEYRHGAGVVGRGLPGGGANPGEPPIDAARRELREETGYEAGRMFDLGWTWANWGSHTNRVHHFLATECWNTGEQNLDANEEITVVASDLKDLECLEIPLRQSFHAVTVMAGSRMLATLEGR